MKPDSELGRLVHRTREDARALRRSTEEACRRAMELMARARDLCARHQTLWAQEAQAEADKQPETLRRIHGLRVAILDQLKQSLSALENVRLISEHDREVRDLKEDIRRTIEGSEAPANDTVATSTLAR